MRPTKITREYSRSINTANYGLAESWVKISAIHEAELESGDDPREVTATLAKRAKADVMAQLGETVDDFKRAVASQAQPGTPARAVDQAVTTSVAAAPRPL